VVSYLAVIGLVVLVGRVARRRRAVRFAAPPEAGSLGEVRGMFAACIALAPLALLCARAWYQEGRPLWVAGACAAVVACVVQAVRAFRRYTREP
jgi:hypothetical protein